MKTIELDGGIKVEVTQVMSSDNRCTNSGCMYGKLPSGSCPRTPGPNSVLICNTINKRRPGYVTIFIPITSNFKGFLKVWGPGTIPIRFDGMVTRLINQDVRQESRMSFEYKSNDPEAKVSIISIPADKYMVQYHEDNNTKES